MLKLLLCLAWSMAIGVALLELRQQQLNLTYQIDALHNHIESSQSELWNQQLNIAECTAPNAVTATLKGQDLKMSAPASNPLGEKNWITTPDVGE
ncbi:MAG: hypothetical protein ABSG31_08990 [Tepidisphaeraceae bacterium]